MISRNIKTYLMVILVSFIGWWGANFLHNTLEDFFYWQEVSRQPEMFLAQIAPKPKVEESAEQEIEEVFGIKAQSVLAVSVPVQGEEIILFEKNVLQQRPIASLTKLMTAVVAQEFYSTDSIFRISREAIEQEEERGELEIGESLSLEELLHIMLIESSNDAAWAIAEGRVASEEEFIDPEMFVIMMNLKAKELGLENTHFVNPTGLDGSENYSTGEDLIKLARYIIINHPQLLEISRKESHEVLKPNGDLHHLIFENTNKLLGEIPGIIGGKTGYTEEAGGCILLVLENEDYGFLIGLVLGASSPETRFEEMKKLIEFSRENL